MFSQDRFQPSQYKWSNAQILRISGATEVEELRFIPSRPFVVVVIVLAVLHRLVSLPWLFLPDLPPVSGSDSGR
jgi:hypothetical protein